jgi:hypothetical protein
MFPTRWLGGSAWAAALVVAACGGSSNDGEGGSGGAGKAGSAAGGAGAGASGANAVGGSGGRPAGAAGAAGAPSGGRTTGGASGSGGLGVGGGLDPSEIACDPRPEVGSACGRGAVPCLDGTSVCYCDASKWACAMVPSGGGAGGTGPIGNVDCPATKPRTGTACGATVGFCPYEGGEFGGCACYQGLWACL